MSSIYIVQATTLVRGRRKHKVVYDGTSFAEALKKAERYATAEIHEIKPDGKSSKIYG